MRSALFGKGDYFKRIKRKPAQELLYQRAIAMELTDEEIETCGQPLWIREALRDIVARGGQTQREMIDKLIAQTEEDQRRAAAQTYPVWVWRGENQTIVPTRGFDLEIETGNFVLIDRARGQVKIDYSLLNLDDAKIQAIESRCEFVGTYTDPGFLELVGSRKQHC